MLSVVPALRPCHTMAAYVTSRTRNERRLTHEKRMTLIKEKNNKHKQRTLPNDERPFKGSNGHETDITGYQKMAFVPHTWAYVALV